MAIFHHLWPNPEPTLDDSSSFKLLVSVMLSAQTTDKQVNQVTPLLFKLAETPEAMAVLSEEKILECIHHVNYAPTKAKHLKKTAQMIKDLYEGNVPTSRELLMTLPGVGRKTANVILSILKIENTFPVDTHVFRVARRLGWSSGTSPQAVEKDLCFLIHPEKRNACHHHLILLGRTWCKSLRPLCITCPLQTWCCFYNIK